MYTITDTEGTPRECEDLDINVWCTEDGEPVRLTIYPAYTDADGWKQTAQDIILVSAETDFSNDDYYDEWYGWNDSVPGEIPGEVVTLVNAILKEVSQ